MPSVGTLTRYCPPQGRIRVENGFSEGDEISVYYDSLLAKVISWGPTRSEAIASMQRALEEFSIEGVKSTIPFCQFVLSHKNFIDGDINTQFIDKHLVADSLSFGAEAELETAAVAAVLLHSRGVNREFVQPNGSNGQRSAWKVSRRDGLR
jgi:propionyl-CoA carboxylase alpha chain